MAKKKTAKKHKFKYAGSPEAVSGSVSDRSVQMAEPRSEFAAPARVGVPNRSMAMSSGRDFSYVGRDLRRIAVLAASLVALELLLWYLFTHTGLGTTVYTFVNI